jgi:hypothetical protein
MVALKVVPKPKPLTVNCVGALGDSAISTSLGAIDVTTGKTVATWYVVGEAVESRPVTLAMRGPDVEMRPVPKLQVN